MVYTKFMNISEQITEEFFTLNKLENYGFFFCGSVDVPSMMVSVSDLQNYLKAINDKIKQLESDN